MPMVPPAPPIFSTMMLWPSVLLMDSPISRATVSVGPPAAAGTISVIDLFGYPCAAALCGVIAAASANAPAERAILIEAVIMRIGAPPKKVLRRFPALDLHSRMLRGRPQLPDDYTN